MCGTNGKVGVARLGCKNVLQEGFVLKKVGCQKGGVPKLSCKNVLQTGFVS